MPDPSKRSQSGDKLAINRRLLGPWSPGATEWLSDEVCGPGAGTDCTALVLIRRMSQREGTARCSGSCQYDAELVGLTPDPEWRDPDA